MSEASNVWRVSPDGTEHDIEVDHNTMTGKFLVTLDGSTVGEGRMLMRRQSRDFEVDGHPARVALAFKYGGFAAESTLHLDDRFVEPLRR